ncbi:lamin tail domain-containing protein, partial [Streptomyces sp. NPDC050264]
MSVARHTRRIAAAILASGVIIGVAAVPAVADGHRAPHRSSVVIGEVQYKGRGHDDHSNRSLNAEWVEV